MTTENPVSSAKALSRYPMGPDNWEIIRGIGKYDKFYVVSCIHCHALIGFMRARAMVRYKQMGLSIVTNKQFSGLDAEPKKDEWWPDNLPRGRKTAGDAPKPKPLFSKGAPSSGAEVPRYPAGHLGDFQSRFEPPAAAGGS